jgi:thiamine-phosphate pyrophosphorylase
VRRIPPGSRLYAILDFDLIASHGLNPLDVLDAWLAAGVRLIQLRAKNLASGPMLDLADAIQERASGAGAVFLVNDRADIARMSGAAGVHVGQEDFTPADARLVVGDRAIVGLSTHNREQLRAAASEPVDYLAIGPVFDTSSKEHPDPVVGLDGLRSLKATVDLRGRPLVGIGGITLDRAPSVIEAGADVVAVISDLLGDDPEKRARKFIAALR